MKLLSQLILGGCVLLLLSGAVEAIDEVMEDDTPVESLDSSLGDSLSAEEMDYIKLECESFAEEDSINPEKYTIYIETCISELSVAVKKAIEKLQADAKPLIDEKGDAQAVED